MLEGGRKLHSETVSGNQTVRGWELKVIGPTCPTEDLKGESNRIIKCEAIINAQHWVGKSLPAAILPELVFFFSVSQKSGTTFKTLLMSHNRRHWSRFKLSNNCLYPYINFLACLCCFDLWCTRQQRQLSLKEEMEAPTAAPTWWRLHSLSLDECQFRVSSARGQVCS